MPRSSLSQGQPTRASRFQKTFQATVQATVATRESADERPVLQMAEWEHLREKQFPNVASSSLAQVIDKLCEGLIQLEWESEQLRSMTYFPHFRSVS